MAAIDEVLSPPVNAPDVPRARSRPRLWPRLLIGFVLGLGACLGLATTALLAWDSGYQGRILPGVHVGGVDLSGLDHDQAVAALGTAFAGYGEGRVVLHTDAGDVTVPYRTFSRRPDVEHMTDQAMADGRDGTTLERAVGEVRLALRGHDLAPSLLVDPDALRSDVTAALLPLRQEPVDAQIGADAGVIQTVPARNGRTYDADVAASEPLTAIDRVDAPDEVVIDVARLVLPPRRSNADVFAARVAAERMLGAVTVTFQAQTWKIKAATVRTWVGFQNGADGSITPSVDQPAIAAALSKVARGVRKDAVSAAYLKTRIGADRRRRRGPQRSQARPRGHGRGHRAGAPGTRGRR